MKSIIVMAIFSIVYLVIMSVVSNKISTLNMQNTEGIVYAQKENSYYTVNIKGAVTNPGTYTVSKGTNLEYLITLAGGTSEDADTSSFNTSVLLKDKSTYYIPRKSAGEEKISINSATISELDELPGIGSVLATRIVAYRNKNGKFTSIESIKDVSGIGDALFEQIKDLITL